VLPALHSLLDQVNEHDVQELATRASQAREIILGVGLSEIIKNQILQAYYVLQEEYGTDLSLAVRSSATAEDLPSASFAGQHDTYLNIHGDEALLDACKRCYASLFTDRAIVYRINNGFDHFKVALSIGIMKMVRSDIAASGVMFSLDTESGFTDVVFITGAYGLGENVVQGVVDPDEFYVHKPTFQSGYRNVLRRRLGEKQVKMVYATSETVEVADIDSINRATTRNIPTPVKDQEAYCINDEEILTLADYAIKVENHYSKQAGHPVPMDMEWAKDGIDGKLYLVQARPETVISQRTGLKIEEYAIKGKGEVLVSGRSVGTRIATGRARVVSDVSKLSEFQAGEVLVAEITTPDWGPVMKKASAIVTNRGGRTCHAAIVARELGVPAVVGTGEATNQIQDGEMVTVSCAEGDSGKVYRGEIPFDVAITDLTDFSRPKTKIMMMLADPDIAFKACMIPNDGVGLVRMEFIISSQIKIHPMALVHLDRVEDANERAEIKRLVHGLAKPEDYFIERMVEGIATIAAAFYPKPVIVRMSDFKSNEYASLLGGKWFEPEEENPMIGFRGASRYDHPAYADGFALECVAMKRVREEMGLKNVKLMIPFCRRIEEGERVLETLAKHGLKRGEQGLEVYVMCEIPNNVIQIDAFAKLFDGFSIGSNDLTQLVLGVDRDSELVAFDYDERDEGVKEMIRQAIEGAKRNGIALGLCGQAPSDYPEMAEYLVEKGIDSMSLNPDTVLKTTLHVLDVEKKLGHS
ncbi:MAG: phosphoenolpyruvate synthase, partial [Gammaproteobacteria bacterium]|nr:phosphoenolpyruvate synthase [Gammaproteobacteria bacterium]